MSRFQENCSNPRVLLVCRVSAVAHATSERREGSSCLGLRDTNSPLRVYTPISALHGIITLCPEAGTRRFVRSVPGSFCPSRGMVADIVPRHACIFRQVTFRDKPTPTSGVTRPKLATSRAARAPHRPWRLVARAPALPTRQIANARAR